jgi:crotonobetainyl-CoA:carnitine CoA-transferase CaiB-like acyl-CoA transferase
VADDDDLRTSGFISTVTTPSGRTHELTTVPWRTHEGPRWTEASPPRVGEHNTAVLQSLLGLPDEEISALERDGVFG